MASRKRTYVTFVDGPHAGERRYGGLCERPDGTFEATGAHPGDPGLRRVYLYRRRPGKPEAEFVGHLRDEPAEGYAPGPPGWSGR